MGTTQLLDRRHGGFLLDLLISIRELRLTICRQQHFQKKFQLLFSKNQLQHFSDLSQMHKPPNKLMHSCALTYLGVYAFETNQRNVAVDFLRKAVEIFSGNVVAYKWLTEVLEYLSTDPIEILHVFYQAIELYPPNLCELT